MPTANQRLGALGEKLVVKTISCPSCKKPKTLKALIQNFKCADIICDYCGYLAQVKASSRANINELPPTISGAAWAPLKERMEGGRFFSLFFVLVDRKTALDKNPEYSIFYLPAELQIPEMFIPRKALSEKAKRAGWQGVTYNLQMIKDRTIRIK